MKKIFSIMATALLAFGFTACEDVPAPYGINADGNGSETPGSGSANVIFSEEFDNGKGNFTFDNVSLGSGISYVWKATSYNTSTYLIASAYAGNASHASEAWAVSPAINLSDCTTATLTFRHAINKIDEQYIPEMMTVWASTDYVPGKAGEATWAQLSVPNYPNGTSWTFVGSGDISLNAFCGKEKVYIGFKYTSTDEVSGSWEVDAFEVKGDGTPMSPETPVIPEQPVTGENLLANGNFESWTDGKPDNWKTTSTAGNATLSQSIDAHSGNYSVKVGGATSANKRIGYKETTLQAGTYTMTFYAKAATANGASVRPGYAAIGGSTPTYVYGDYTNNLSSTEWTQVQHTFTLESETEICIIVMNSKNPGGDVLIDDFTLTSADGGAGEGGGSTTEPETPSTGDAIFSATMASDLGGFTIEDKNLPAELSYVWKHDSSYGYVKGSAYISSPIAAESWLISPVIDLTTATAPTLTFEHAGKFFGDMTKETQLMGKAEGGEWIALPIDNYFSNTDWTFVTATVSLDSFKGKKMQFAFVYKSTSANAGSWEVKNVTVK